MRAEAPIRAGDRGRGLARRDVSVRTDAAAVSQARRNHRSQPPQAPPPPKHPRRPRTHRRLPQPAESADRSDARRADLSGRAVHRVVTTPAAASATTSSARTRPFAEIVELLQDHAETARRARLRGAAGPHVRRRTLPRGDDGVSAGRDGEGLHVGRVGGLSEPEARRPAGALQDDHPDRAGAVPARDSDKYSDPHATRSVLLSDRSCRLCRGTRATSPPCPSAAMSRTCCVSSIEQNFGPHIEQKCATLAPSAGSVASW